MLSRWVGCVCLKIGGHEGVVIKYIKLKAQELVRPAQEGLRRLGLGDPPTSLPFAPTVLEARVRQLQAESVSEVTVKRVGMARRLPASGGFQPPGKAQTAPEDAATELSGRWAQKLDKEKFAMEKRKQRLEVKLQVRARQLACEHRLRVVPRLLDAQLASCLQHWEHGAPRGHWEEQLTQLLQEAPRKPSPAAEPAPKAESASVRREIQQQRLLAFFECCLLTGHLPLAHHVLVTFHSRSRQQRRLTLAMYNTIMLGWARKVSGGPGTGGGGPAGVKARVALRRQPWSCCLLPFQRFSRACQA